jgi:uncharacterized protein YaeQ
MKYTFTILRSDDKEADSSKPAREKIVLESRSSESDRHIALKVLAYLCFRDTVMPLSLRIEQAVGQRHKPDLVSLEPETGRVRLWIDCGQIEPKRLGRIVAANPTAEIIVVKATDREARLYARAAASAVPEGERSRVRFLGFEEGFLRDVLDELRGANTLEAAIVADRLRLTINGRALVTDLRPFQGLLENYRD